MSPYIGVDLFSGVKLLIRSQQSLALFNILTSDFSSTLNLLIDVELIVDVELVVDVKLIVDVELLTSTLNLSSSTLSCSSTFNSSSGLKCVLMSKWLSILN